MKTKFLFLLFIFFYSTKFISAQTKFSRLFWQNAGEIIRSTAVDELNGGGYIMAGTVKDSAAGSLTDIFIAKFNSVGDTVWTNRIGAPGTEGVNDIRQTSDGGFILTGFSDSFGAGTGEIVLLKTDSLGQVSWTKLFGSANYDIGYSVRQNADGGYIVAGNYLFIRTNASGDTLWTKKYTLGTFSTGSFAEETPAGDFILALASDTTFSADEYAVILKVDASGIPIWAKKITSTFNMFTTHDISQTFDGGYLFIAEDDIGLADIAVVKVDGNGNVVFAKTFLPDGTSLYMVKGIELIDSTYRIAVSYYSAIGNSGTLLLKLNSSGDTISTKKYNDLYLINDGEFTSDGGFISPDYYNGIHKMDSSFDRECNQTILHQACTVIPATVSNSAPQYGEGTIVTSATFTNIAGVKHHLYTPCTPNVPTCVVTVDSATQKNLVVWEENFDTTFIDSYQVYKESAAAGIYNLIGSVPHNQLSVFLDTASNPAAQSDRYRVSALWHTYYEPPNTVAGHKTIHLLVSPGLPPTMNLSWSSYEGFTYSTYNVWRGNGISSSIIASLPYGTNNYTDLNPPAGDSLYYVEVVHAPCNPTFRLGNGGGGGNVDLSTYNGTISNRFNTSLYFVGLNDIELTSNITLSPVPASNELIISPRNFLVKSVIIINTMGQQLAEYKFNDLASDQIQLDVSNLSAGVYSLQVFGGDNKRITKLFVKH